MRRMKNRGALLRVEYICRGKAGVADITAMSARHAAWRIRRIIRGARATRVTMAHWPMAHGYSG